MPNLVNIANSTDIVREPGAYNLKSILLINHQGREVELAPFVTDFTIYESIYKPYLTIEINVKDYANLFEELQLSGQEKINLEYSKEDISIGNVKIKKNFIVTEYPAFGNASNRERVYQIRAITPHAYLSRFTKISRSFQGKTTDLITEIVTQDLLTKLEITGDTISIIQGIYPNLTPLDAIQWLLRRTIDEHNRPFYFYETLFDGSLQLVSDSAIRSLDVYNEYDNGTEFTFDPTTNANEDYLQRMRRILKISSDIKLSKFINGAMGAFSSRTNYLDLSNKVYRTENFVIKPNDWKELSTTFSIADRTLDTFTDSREFNIPTRDESNYHKITELNSIGSMNSVTELLDTIVHDIELNGDPLLTTGKLIDISFIQPINPELDQAGYTNKGNPERDSYLSGSYLTTSIIHNFRDRYTQNLRVKKII